MAKKRLKVYYEYPLFDQHKLCPTARYVGGTSKYLCECKDPKGCAGWTASAWMYGVEPFKMETYN